MVIRIKWRRFNFFEKESTYYPDSNEIFDKLKDINISACASGRGQIIIGDHNGFLHFINRKMEITEFEAYKIRVSHLFQMKQHNLLISIGEDEQGVNPLIKVWNLDKMDRGIPLCTRIARAIPGNKPSHVTCLTVHENLNWMAIGFECGSVVLYKGDVTRDRHSKFRVVYENQRPITGLGFRISGKNIILFVVTETSVVSISITSKDQRIILDQFGCKARCSVMSGVTQDNQLVLGRSDVVYFYQPDGRGPCLALEGEKLMLVWFRGYLITVRREKRSLPPMSNDGLEMNIVTIYDIQNKFIAFVGPFPEIIDIVYEWGSIFILAGDKRFYQLIEKDTQTKLDILFRKNLYNIAINLAKSQHYDQGGLIDIFTQYGDHLYSKGDHDGAIEQYIKTIGKLEASYVIRKFLDAQRIHNLTRYLQALHKQTLATEEHTTLLLNCYTRLKDVSELDKFIKTKDREVDFDVETAIKVCRQAGYYEHALFLADKYNIHKWYLKIQLEDIKDFKKALEYIGKLSFAEAEENMKKYGKTLMREVPQPTTEVLKQLCTDYRPSDQPLIDQNVLDGGIPKIQKAPAEEFIHIFVSSSARLTEFLEHMIKVQPNSSSLLYNTLLELYLQNTGHETEPVAKSKTSKEDKERKTLELLQGSKAGYDINQALVLCQMHNFTAGILYLYEKAELYEQILRYHMDHDEYGQVINTCKRFGIQEPNLWVQSLSYFAMKEDNCKTFLMEVLSHIDKKNLLPPLLVIQTLANNSAATLSVVKDYIVKRLQQENDQITEDERLIQQYREDTLKKKNQIEELKTSAKIFQAPKCSICNHPLEIPSVHFLCEPHSYHQHCFECYGENECPVCMQENRKVMEVIRAQEQNKDIHEHFHNELDRVQDGFSLIADYFGRGIFSKKSPMKEYIQP
ncbi:vacuolar protein sorting-associated protein 11 homolog isoform X3 [Octopus sinensis]|uniref:Vacuolar protein sorting-associated protein 11 homolog n=1 Tax=Octopus sinensis TaxID=2607531 RepID=A0A7E6FLJ5_9MOLL|nr:vacuolar protein sorting-associated protein 11 homolog isoform X3 [Octopus sinensis]